MQQTIFIAVSQIYFLVGTALVANRIWIRVLNRGELFSRNKVSTWSDILLVLAVVIALGADMGTIILYNKNAMVKAKEFNDKLRRDRYRMFIAYVISYVQTGFTFSSLYCVKGTILCFLFEITPSGFIKLRRAIWVAAVMSFLGWLFTICVVWLPFKQLGNNLVCYRRWVTTGRPEDSCFTAAKGYSVVAVDVVNCLMVLFHLVTDIYIYTIPFFLLSTLPLITWQQRIAAGVMFGAGFLVVLLGSTYVLILFVAELQEPVMWRFWTALHEVTLAIAVPCLPAFRVTFVKFRRYYQGGALAPAHEGIFNADEVANCPRESGGSKGTTAKERRSLFMRRMTRGVLETKEVADQGQERGMDLKKSVTSTLSTVTQIKAGPSDNV